MGDDTPGLQAQGAHTSPPSPARAGVKGSRLRRLALAAPLALYALVVFTLHGCGLTPPRANSIAVAERVEVFPSRAPNLRAPATITWDARSVPFIETQHADDAPYLLGMVHAHLRLGQMETLRRISQGRLSESAGPIPQVTDIDHALRILGFADGARASESALRDDTRFWVERYTQGINDYRAQLTHWPPETPLLAFDKSQEWTVRDVLTIGRLASTDINWLWLTGALPLRSQPGGEELLREMRDIGALATPSFGPRLPASAIDLAASVGKTGSNSFAVSGSRTASGHAILANDPHVGFMLPNLWCMVGYSVPQQDGSEHRVLGLTLPGLPAVLLGRNQRIAWGGTNMQSISSSLLDVSNLPADQVTSERVTIARRLFLPAQRTIRRTPFGPIITDAAPLRDLGLPDLALRWRGHEPSDELSAFLDVSRAQSWEQFRAAWKPYAVSGQNFLYADVDGNIGQVLALEFDVTQGELARDNLSVGDATNPAHTRTRRINSLDLPAAFQPDAGFLVSSNNTPVRTDPPIVPMGNWNDRQNRLEALLSEEPALTLERAGQLQLDVYSASAHALAGAIADRVAATAPALTPQGARAVAALRNWDGRYDVDSPGAPIYTEAIASMVRRRSAAQGEVQSGESLLRTQSVHAILKTRVKAGEYDAVLAPALDTAGRLREDLRWGDVHRLRVQHLVGNVPVLGRAYRFGELPVPGSLNTVWKTATDVAPGVQYTRYGANSRLIHDLRDPDENYLVLMGGQDGWLGSAAFADQVEDWLAGRLHRVSMTRDGVRRDARFISEVSPAESGK